MPEPNLPPLRLTYDPLESNKSLVNVALMRKRLVELPEVTRKRLVKRYGLRLPAAIILVVSETAALVLPSEDGLYNFFFVLFRIFRGC